MAEFDSVIPAGSSGQLVARLKTAAGQSGRVSKQIAVTTDAPGAVELRLRFSVEVHMPVRVSPAYRFSISMLEGRSGSARLVLARDDERPLRVLGMGTDRADLELVVAAATSDEGSASGARDATPTPWGQAGETGRERTVAEGVPVELRASSSLPAGTFSGKVRITTDHPEAAELDIPYTVRVRPVIEAQPPSVRLWASAAEGEPGRSAMVRLRQNAGEAFSVTGIEVSHPQHILASMVSAQASSEQTLRLGLPPGLDETKLVASVQGWVRIRTDDRERPLIQVPVLVAPTRPVSSRPVRGEG